MGQNERKYLFERGLWSILWFWAAKKQTQFKANFNFTAENAECAEQKGICVNGCPIKKYNLHLTSLRSLRTQRLMRNKANLLGRRNLPKPSPKPAALRLPPSAGRRRKRVIWKNKANFRKGKMTLSQYWQWVMEILMGRDGEKTKPIQSQFWLFAEGNAEFGERTVD